MSDARGDAAPPHWREWGLEGALLGAFMISAGLCGTLLEAPASPVHQALPDPFVRRIVMGACMGLTAVGIIYSPWGSRSGAHINPAVTLTFARLGRVRWVDAGGYIALQLVGAVLGTLVVAVVARQHFLAPPVHAIATVPGPAGPLAAFLGEGAISLLLMFTVLAVSSHPRYTRYTGFAAGALVMAWIIVEAPLSGMSMNPARSFGSAVVGSTWRDFWIYLVAPPLGMLSAAELFRAVRGRAAVHCAKLHHRPDRPCIFCGAGSA